MELGFALTCGHGTEPAKPSGEPSAGVRDTNGIQFAASLLTSIATVADEPAPVTVAKNERLSFWALQ